MTATTPWTMAPVTSGPWTVAPEPADSPDARTLWAAYYTEVSDRWFRLHHGSDTPSGELERGIAADDGPGQLVAPHGLLLVARLAGTAAGTAGLALLEPGTAELRRVFVRPSARGERGGSALMAAADAAAGALGATRLVLDTRHDLVESHRLYERHGFTRTEAYNEGPYAERWYARRLAPAES
ncbi:GNAT family N-acetyltransferase [Streptomyces sp. CHA1]|uniref:GNAT family N-acetyltransferase n=1 Tax=unclassified Streptomyces TaxID=2593676 RepID=UPI001BFC7795|nr:MULTISPECIES: GNAT family N-acetyltransferase [unclassified Streptomyces]MBT3157685.1 GNAT family N-acetyltransferase [Streptomyces sp. G11C]MCO6703062.1 GNAT family N-acetyltransferase [Streptomyces sp. CHB9.2]MCO6709499.1 GNAT family N-acetyltransferase [Streptomyces sp. CHA3]MCO6715242.1 GNAT family N-acetyltransferase [Streptomyces sp. CHB19.2]MCO6721367.1 GNAT family N-acetyltransferase [Streptomyces sp. Vc714c-19]